MLHLTNLDFPLPNYVPGDAAELDGMTEEELLERGCKLLNIQVEFADPDYPSIRLPWFFWQVLDRPQGIPRTLRHIAHWRTLKAKAKVFEVNVDAGNAESSISVPPKIFEFRMPLGAAVPQRRLPSGERWWQ